MFASVFVVSCCVVFICAIVQLCSKSSSGEIPSRILVQSGQSNAGRHAVRFLNRREIKSTVTDNHRPLARADAFYRNYPYSAVASPAISDLHSPRLCDQEVIDKYFNQAPRSSRQYRPPPAYENSSFANHPHHGSATSARQY